MNLLLFIKNRFGKRGLDEESDKKSESFIEDDIPEKLTMLHVFGFKNIEEVKGFFKIGVKSVLNDEYNQFAFFVQVPHGLVKDALSYNGTKIGGRKILISEMKEISF